MGEKLRNRIYLSPPFQSGREQEVLNEVLKSNWLTSAGRHLSQFESELATLFNFPHVVAVQSGTAALHLILSHLGVTYGDKVVVSDLTFAGSVNPIRYVGAIPVFIDSEIETWNMCPLLLEKYFSENLDDLPKAVVLVHLFGVPAKIKKIKSICKKYGVILIEDCAEALGTSVDGQYLGTFGDFGFLSFNGNKLITTSGGGAILVKEKEVADRFLYLATQAKSDVPYYHHEEVGFNYRMSNLLAGLGLAQLQGISKRILKKQEIYQRYKEILSEYGFHFIPFSSENCYWLSTALIDDLDPLEITTRLDQSYNIEARPVWKPMHLQPVFEKFPSVLNGNSKEIFSKGICLPSGVGLLASDQLHVCEVIKKIISHE